MKLGVILTTRCNAMCAHCSHGYGPSRSEELDIERIRAAMDEAAALDDGSPLIFLFTGGEPFTHFDRLRQIVEHGSRLGGSVYTVTNAYWASSDDRAMSKLSILRGAGLSGLSVSVSRFHQMFVPLERPRRALRIARQLGLATELKGAVTHSELAPEGALQRWREQLDAGRTSLFPVLPYLRDGATLPTAQYINQPGLPTQTCPGEVLTIDQHGMVRSCCTPGPLDEFLALGRIQDTPLAKIRERLQNRGQQRVLREMGPVYFACGALSQGLGDSLRSAYAGPCDLCIHIRSDPQLRRVAEEIAADYPLRGPADAAPLLTQSQQGAHDSCQR